MNSLMGKDEDKDFPFLTPTSPSASAGNAVSALELARSVAFVSIAFGCRFLKDK